MNQKRREPSLTEMFEATKNHGNTPEEQAWVDEVTSSLQDELLEIFSRAKNDVENELKQQDSSA